MSHAVESMFSVKERPWHGLGTILTEAPSIQEGIIYAGLDWEVKTEKLKTETGIDVTTKNAVVRQDNQSILGVVGNQYKPLQNKDAFNFFEPFIENNMATLETAGSLYNGAIVFILAKINSDNIVVNDEDQIEKYILLSNSHDGSQALRIGYTPIRVVCNNTLQMATTSDKSQLIRLTHRKDIISNMEDLRATMDLINQQFIATEEQYKELAKKDINGLDLHRYVRKVFSQKKLEALLDEEKQEELETGRKKIIARVEEIFQAEPKHNAWTLYNAVNYYLNHERGKNLESRYSQLWFGYAKHIDKKAFELALAA